MSVQIEQQGESYHLRNAAGLSLRLQWQADRWAYRWQTTRADGSFGAGGEPVPTAAANDFFAVFQQCHVQRQGGGVAVLLVGQAGQVHFSGAFMVGEEQLVAQFAATRLSVPWEESSPLQATWQVHLGEPFRGQVLPAGSLVWQEPTVLNAASPWQLSTRQPLTVEALPNQTDYTCHLSAYLKTPQVAEVEYSLAPAHFA